MNYCSENKNVLGSGLPSGVYRFALKIVSRHSGQARPGGQLV